MSPAVTPVSGDDGRTGSRFRLLRSINLRIDIEAVAEENTRAATTPVCDDDSEAPVVADAAVGMEPAFFNDIRTQLPEQYLRRRRKTISSLQYAPIEITYVHNPYSFYQSVEVIY
eukprot:TRINITY_DN34253_c0_g1_i1.p2 TRINITY_DN34253_c0_g1~~TRINITY_DN34253_c0_g1_i1.p2  ORF type:complete len:115 (+),score=20.65 TRINITY_DN34253_c0_g1_i1:92-436(+)